MTAGRTWSISAEWVVPGDGRTLHRAVVRGRGAVIEAVGPLKGASLDRRHRELGEVAVLPGLVNAHTHLELTDLRGQIPARRSLSQWLYAVRSHWPARHQIPAAVRAGAQQALATGTTTLADTSHHNLAHRALRDLPIRKACFAEVTGIGAGCDQAIAKLRQSIRGMRPSGRLRCGIAPHAPYYAAEGVYRQAVALARRRNWLISTHLAETEAERQFLLRGSGELLDFLARQGMAGPSLDTPRCTPVAFAGRVGLLNGPCILVHVNYLDDAEIKALAGRQASVVYCPRSCDYFGRGGHRYAEMLNAGINVALGTESLAGNTSLDMLDEMRRVRADARLSNQAILRMGTLNGALALGWADQIGSLEPGKQADWIAVEMPPDVGDPLEAIFTGGGRVVEVAIAGRTVYTAGQQS